MARNKAQAAGATAEFLVGDVSGSDLVDARPIIGVVAGSWLPWDGGVAAEVLMAALSPLFGQIDHHELSDAAVLWEDCHR